MRVIQTKELNIPQHTIPYPNTTPQIHSSLSHLRNRGPASPNVAQRIHEAHASFKPPSSRTHSLSIPLPPMSSQFTSPWIPNSPPSIQSYALSMSRHDPYFSYHDHKTLSYHTPTPPRVPSVSIIICASPSLTAPGTSHAALLFSFPSSSSSSALVAHLIPTTSTTPSQTQTQAQTIELKPFKSPSKVLKGAKGILWGGGRVEIAIELGEIEKQGVGRGEVEAVMLGTGKGKGGAWSSSQRWVYATVKIMEREKGWLRWGGTDGALKRMEEVMGREG